MDSHSPCSGAKFVLNNKKSDNDVRNNVYYKEYSRISPERFM